MATLGQLQAMAADNTAEISAIDVAQARMSSRLAHLPASADIERRILEAYVGHLRHLRKVRVARGTLLAAEVVKVQGGGTSTLLVGTTSAEVPPSERAPRLPGRNRSA